MNNEILIRPENPNDFDAVELLTRRAFYNVYAPGCMEHYLVRVMRPHPDFVRELDLVAELDGQIVGNIMYTKSTLTDEAGQVKEILTFGPISVSPEHQRRGIGKMLMEHSFQLAKELGYDAIVIVGSPANYVSSGFRSAMAFGISTEDGRFPAAMLTLELATGALAGKKWVFRDSPVMAVDPQAAQRYDDTLPPMEKKHMPSQEEFFIMSQAFLSPEGNE